LSCLGGASHSSPTSNYGYGISRWLESAGTSSHPSQLHFIADTVFGYVVIEYNLTKFLSRARLLSRIPSIPFLSFLELFRAKIGVDLNSPLEASPTPPTPPAPQSMPLLQPSLQAPPRDGFIIASKGRSNVIAPQQPSEPLRPSSPRLAASSSRPQGQT
jgi:hypothetical protein